MNRVHSAASGSIPVEGGTEVISKLQAGDWAVYDGGYSYCVVQIERVTAAQVWPASGTGGFYTPKRIDRSAVLFAGEKAQAFTIQERLTSSSALMREDQQRASRRHRDRVAKIVGITTHDR